MTERHLQLEELDDLLENAGDELYTYMKVLCRNGEEAADLIQNVFIKFIEQVERGRIERITALHYLKRMCRNEFYDYLREKKREVVLADYNNLSVDSRKEKVESNSERIRIVLLEALDRPELPPEVAEALRLRLVSELNYRDICDRMDRSRSTVQRLLRQGLVFLVEAFREAGLSTEELEN